MLKAKLVVLISGNGSNLQAIIDACEAGILNAEVVAVISNKRSAYGLERAKNHDITSLALPKKKVQSRSEYDSDLAKQVKQFEPDLVVLAGWLRILSMNFLSHFPNNQVINIHPALPDTFPGLHAIERAYEAFQKGEINQTGVMVHFVPDEGVDDGPVLVSEVVEILSSDSLDDLAERIHAVEHRLYIDTLQKQLNSKL